MDVIGIIPATIAFIVIVVGSRVGRVLVTVVKIMLPVLVILAATPHRAILAVLARSWRRERICIARTVACAAKTA